MSHTDELVLDYAILMTRGTEWLKDNVIILGSYLVLKGLFGRDISLWMNRWFTRQYVIKRMPNVVKITGATGSGKDTTGVAMSILLRREFIKAIDTRIDDIHDILYQIDLKKISDYFKANYQGYVITDEDIYDRDLNRYLSQGDYVKKSYRHMWSWKVIYTSYVEKDIQKRYMRYHSYDDIHMVDIMKEYIGLVIRRQIDNYIMSNQPIKEDHKVMAKILSNNFMKLIHDETIMHNKRQYSERVQFPFIKYMVLYETESDAWWSNVDPNVRGTILRYGIRNFKAFNRHILGERIYMISVGQNSGRQNKLLRELDHAVLRVVDKIESDGHTKTRFILSLGKLLLSLGIFITRPVKVVSHRLQHIKSKVKNYQEKLKDYGHIEVDVVISAHDETGATEAIRIEDIIAKRLFKVKYSTRLTFKSTDTRGRYNTHYLDVIGKELKKKSEINILSVPNWQPSLKMDKSSALYINSKILNDSLQIPDEEIYKKFYKVIKDLSKNNDITG